MANEIVVLDKVGDGYQLLFLYVIATPKQIAGANIAPTPSSQLPFIGAAVLNPPEKVALDAGTSAFEIITFIARNMSDADVQARARELYTKAKGAFLIRYREQFHALVGTRINA